MRGDQAGARPAEHHESGQDDRALSAAFQRQLPPTAVNGGNKESGRRSALGCDTSLQNTLLGLAIAIILAVLTALVGPLVIDWGGHRSLFEEEASRLVGVDVRVDRRDRRAAAAVAAAHAAATRSRQRRRRAKFAPRSLGIEFALGPLMRGEWRASEMSVSGPQFHLGSMPRANFRGRTSRVRLRPRRTVGRSAEHRERHCRAQRRGQRLRAYAEQSLV